MKMAEKATFYHAGYSISVDAEQRIASALAKSKCDIAIVYLGENKVHLEEAESVKAPLALVIGGTVYHINHGASALH
jgi:hypothetical protein